MLAYNLMILPRLVKTPRFLPKGKGERGNVIMVKYPDQKGWLVSRSEGWKDCGERSNDNGRGCSGG